MVEECGFCDIRTLGLLYGFFQQSVLLLETGCKGGAFLRNLSHPSVASEYHRNLRSNTQNDSGQGNQKPGVFSDKHRQSHIRLHMAGVLLHKLVHDQRLICFHAFTL